MNVFERGSDRLFSHDIGKLRRCGLVAGFSLASLLGAACGGSDGIDGKPLWETGTLTVNHGSEDEAPGFTYSFKTDKGDSGSVECLIGADESDTPKTHDVEPDETVTKILRKTDIGLIYGNIDHNTASELAVAYAVAAYNGMNDPNHLGLDDVLVLPTACDTPRS